MRSNTSRFVCSLLSPLALVFKTACTGTPTAQPDGGSESGTDAGQTQNDATPSGDARQPQSDAQVTNDVTPPGVDSPSGGTCGNGTVDPGENCDGSALGGATCMCLGFQSGTLACSASCQFDTSGCTGAITLTVTPSRTSCVAPCGVFFDATPTTGLSNADYVNANFSWDFGDPTSPHPHTIGFVVAHVFDNPGTYTVATSVRDLAGNAGSTTTTITVTAMTGPTYYVAQSGSDSNTGTDTGHPLASLTHALALAGTTGPVSILLQRGDTFNIGTTTYALSVHGPFLIGAYGAASAAAPILNSTLDSSMTGAYEVLFGITGSSELRVTDLHITANHIFALFPEGNSTYTLIERVEAEGFGYSSPCGSPGQAFYADHASSNSFVVDCHFHNFFGLAMYGDSPVQFAMIGTVADQIHGGAEGVRVQGGTGAGAVNAMNNYVAENTISYNVGEGAFEALTFRGNDQNAVCVGNIVNRYVSIAPQNYCIAANERVQNALYEGNTIYDAEDGFEQALVITANHVVVRNNLFVNAYAPISVVGEMGIQGITNPLPDNWVDQVYIYNNTAYIFPPTSSQAYQNYALNGIHHAATTGSITVRNNIFATGIASPATFFNGTGSNEVVDHNLIYAPIGGAAANSMTGSGGRTVIPCSCPRIQPTPTPFGSPPIVLRSM